MATAEMNVGRKAPDKLFIDGAWVEAAGGARFPTYNPSTGEVLAEVDPRIELGLGARDLCELRVRQHLRESEQILRIRRLEAHGLLEMF